MEPEFRLFMSGTMRTGGSLLTNMLSAHSSILVFSERVHFFRFIYKRYDPLSEKNVARLLQHLGIRLRHRYKLEIDIDGILTAITEREISYPAIYPQSARTLSS